MHITGSLESVSSAARIILEKLGEEDGNRYEHMSTSYRHLTAFPQRPYAMLPPMPPPHSRGMQPMMHFPGPPPLPPPPPHGGDRRGPPRPPPFGGPPGPPRVGALGDLETSTLTMTVQDACVPAVVGRGGSIINVSSTAGIRPRPGLVWYNGTKGAVNTITQCMAIELAADNIRVNAV